MFRELEGTRELGGGSRDFKTDRIVVEEAVHNVRNRILSVRSCGVP